MRISVAGLAVAAIAGLPLRSQGLPPEIGYRTMHIFDLDSQEAEVELVQIMARFNALFEELGHPECSYHLWRLTETGELPSFMWTSTWPSRAVYDEVHALEAYNRLLSESFSSVAALLKNHRYGQYREIPLDGPGGS